MAEDQCNQSTILQNLMDAGCDPDFAKEYLKLDAEGCTKKQLDLLARHRRILLDQVHKYHKYLDCLDFLIYKIKNKKSN